GGPRPRHLDGVAQTRAVCGSGGYRVVMAAVGENAVFPATYDAVWSLVPVAILVAVTLIGAAAMPALRRRAAGDTVARVQSLAALHASGAITGEEYETRRERLLDQLRPARVPSRPLCEECLRPASPGPDHRVSRGADRPCRR